MGGDEFFNSSGGNITGEYGSEDKIYTITFKGLGTAGASSGHQGVSLVTAEGADSYKRTCNKSTLSSDSGGDAMAKVVCYNLATGDNTESTFSVMYIR
ncbi:hypothetical protein [Oceanithermus sp.]